MAGFGEILDRGWEVDERGGDGALDDVLDAGVAVRREDPVGQGGLPFGQHGAVLPGIGVVGHGVGQGPEHVAPGDDLAEKGLVAAAVVAAGGVQGLGEQAGEEIQFHGEAGAALEQEAVEEAGGGEEAEDARGVAVDQHVFPGDEDVGEHEDGVVLVEAGR